MFYWRGNLARVSRSGFPAASACRLLTFSSPACRATLRFRAAPPHCSSAMMTLSKSFLLNLRLYGFNTHYSFIPMLLTYYYYYYYWHPHRVLKTVFPHSPPPWNVDTAKVYLSMYFMYNCALYIKRVRISHAPPPRFGNACLVLFGLMDTWILGFHSPLTLDVVPEGAVLTRMSCPPD